MKEEDRESCIQSCILDASCLGYGHVFPVDCILIISNLGADLISNDIFIDDEIFYNDTEYELYWTMFLKLMKTCTFVYSAVSKFCCISLPISGPTTHFSIHTRTQGITNYIIQLRIRIFNSLYEMMFCEGPLILIMFVHYFAESSIFSLRKK